MTSKRLTIAKLLIAATGLSMVPTADAATQQHARASIEGSWVGDFGAGPWTFKFTNLNGAWSGTYTYPQYAGWNPVIGLAASDQAARFSIRAKSDIAFNLKLDRSGRALSGTVRFGHGVTPASAPVVVPVELKRK